MSQFISSQFSAQLDQRKEQAKIRIQTEINFLVDDLFSLFTSEFNRKLQCIEAVYAAQSSAASSSSGHSSYQYPSLINKAPKQKTNMPLYKNSKGLQITIINQSENPRNHHHLENLQKQSIDGNQSGPRSLLETNQNNSPIKEEFGSPVQKGEDEEESYVIDSDPSDSDCDCDDCFPNDIVKIEQGEEVAEMHRENQSEVPKPRKRQRKNHENADAEEDSTASSQVITLRLNCIQSNCPETFANAHDLNYHVNQAHRILAHRCIYPSCTQSFATASQLKGHIRTEHVNAFRNWRCEECQSDFSHYHGLYNHLRQFHQFGTFRCSQPECDFTADCRAKIKYHYETDHAKPRFSCDICGKVFTRPNHLRTHLSTHTGARPFVCLWGEGCEYSAAHRTAIIQHIRSQHFNLPRTLREQRLKGIVDSRNPEQYFEVRHDLM